MDPVATVPAMTFGVAQLMHKDEQGGYGLLLQPHAYVWGCSLGDRRPAIERSHSEPPPPGLAWCGKAVDILSKGPLLHAIIISIFLGERREDAVQL